MPLEINLFIFLACKWDIVPLMQEFISNVLIEMNTLI